MAQVHHVRAAKDYPDEGIKKGEMYYWWKFRYGGKRKSKTAPRPSQLTSSEKKSRCYAAQEDIEDAFASFRLELKKEAFDRADCFMGLLDAFENAVEELTTVSEEYQESADNMEIEGEVKENCEEAAREIESQKDEVENLRDKIESYAERFADNDELYDWNALSEEWEAEVHAIEFGPSVF